MRRLTCTAIEMLERRVCRAADFASVISAGAGGSDRGNALDLDPAGNSIVAGVFNGSVDFDPSAAALRLTAASTTAAFVAKYSPGGAIAWARGFGGSGEQNIQAVATDWQGNVYAAGYFSGKLDFDPGAATHAATARGDHDAFVVKLSAGGVYVWSRTFGGGGEEGCTALDVDAAGRAYVVGMFDSPGDYDPSAATKTLTSHGSFDVFALQLDAAGNLEYAKSVGGSGEDYGNGVSADSAGRAVVAGTFTGGVDLDPGTAVHLTTSAGGKDVFVLGLDAAGGYRFGRSFGGKSDDQAGDVRLDSDGNAIVIGQFAGTADFDPSTAKATLTSAGSTDAFFAKLGPAGNYVWAKRVGGSSADRATNLAIDAKSNVYVTGQFAGQVDFDPGVGNVTRASTADTQDVFATKLSPAGGYVWSRTAGGRSTDIGEAIAVDGHGAAYVVGTFGGTVDFDPSAVTHARTAAGTYDWFLWKLIAT